MIDRTEIEQEANHLGISTTNVQRDYIFGWILAGIYGQSDLGPHLVLKGGNCFRKAYAPLGRFSNDLDFAAQLRVDYNRMREQLTGVCEYVQAATGVDFQLERTSVNHVRAIDSERNKIEAKLYFKDFYGVDRTFDIRVTLDISEYDRPRLPIQSRPLIHAYSDATKCKADVRCVQLEELLADKLKCLIQRRHIVDLFDLVFSLFVNGEYDVNRGLVARTFLEKSIFHRSPAAARDILESVPSNLREDDWNSYVVPPTASRFPFTEALARFAESIAALFQPYPSSAGLHAFYPVEHRNKIIEAGRSKTVLRLRYHRRERLVEPYSLTFKVRRSDGVGQEYFYAYDQTGGVNSGPGIKQFLHQDIELLEPTEIAFSPRYEIELSKAGDIPDKLHFEGTRKTSPWNQPMRVVRPRKPATRGWRPRPVMSYRVQCPLCGKTFPRSKPTTKLNAHKNTFGSKCPGRRGYLV